MVRENRYVLCCPDKFRSAVRADEAARALAAADVTSPLTGPGGEARLFGPQKGASASELAELEAGLGRLAALVGMAPETPGAGAAGGFAVPFLGLLGAGLQSGADLVRRLTGFDRALSGAGSCLTGEGQVERQSAQGKTVAGVLRAARERGVPATIVGAVERGAAGLLDDGAAGLFAIGLRPRGLTDALPDTAADLQWFGRNYGHLVRGLSPDHAVPQPHRLAA